MHDPNLFLLEPSIVMLGCQAWPPRPDPNRTCAVCDQGIRRGEDRTYCGLCDSTSPAIEARVRAARIGRKSSGKAEEAQARLKSSLPRRTLLTESQRRRIWNGYRGGIQGEAPHADTGELTNLAKAGRDWLTAIGQAPDWSIRLGPRGKVVGRHADLEVEAA